MQSVNNLRGIAILLIILTHCVSEFTNLSMAAHFVDYAVGNGSMIFMFISGYLFMSSNIELHYQKYIKGRALSVVLPYLVMSLPASLIYVLGFKHEHIWINMAWFDGQLGPFEKYLFLTLTGAQLGPFWFIPMVILFFLLAPLFHYIGRSKALLPILGASIIVAALVGRAEDDSNPLQSFVFFTPSYLLGIAVYRYRSILSRVQATNLWLKLAYVCLYLVIFFIFYTREPAYATSLNMLLYLPILLILMGTCESRLNRKNLWLDLFARLSFFLYFIHGYFVAIARELIAHFGLDRFSEQPAQQIGTIILSFAVIIVASLCSYMGLKLLLRDNSRFVIGG